MFERYRLCLPGSGLCTISAGGITDLWKVDEEKYVTAMLSTFVLYSGIVPVLLLCWPETWGRFFFFWGGGGWGAGGLVTSCG